MPAPNNMITTAQMNLALEQEVIEQYTGEFDRLMEILGIFEPEVMRGGQTLYQVKIDGELNNSKNEEAGTSSGTSYVEGDLVALSEYRQVKTPIEIVDIEPYRKMTTAAAINKSGYRNAVYRTDRKMLSHVRSQVVGKFFKFLENGTGKADATSTLQHALAKVDGTLGNALESNHDEAGALCHFVNRMDAADYLGTKEINNQNAFGLTYLANFLGVQNVFLTNRVAPGKVIVTPTENIRIYSLDFANLSDAGLVYTTDESGLIGVAHTPAYDRVGAETHVVNGSLMVPYVTDYIVTGTFGATEASHNIHSGEGLDPAQDIPTV